MRLVIQRVQSASVHIEKKIHASIGRGLLLFAGIEHNDNEEDCRWLAARVINLRIFDDENGVMNLPVTAIKGEILVISQFTLHASTRKGNRPSYMRAAKPEVAIPLYEKFIVLLNELSGIQTKSGVFGAHMDIHLINDGPVTILIDSKSRE